MKLLKLIKHYIFGRDGSVINIINKLSNNKQEQELIVANRFKMIFNDCYSKQIGDVVQLEEADHDICFSIDGEKVLVQLTELVDIPYTKKISRDEYDLATHKNYYLKESGTIPYAVDDEKRSKALIKSIEKKLEQNYSSSSNLWLIIFTTDSSYTLEFFQYGKKHFSPEYSSVIEYLSNFDNIPFSEIWFFSLQTRPTKIYER